LFSRKLYPEGQISSHSRMVDQEDIQLTTRGHADLRDVTALVARIVERSGIR
jgi:hypothetical protein